MEYCASDQDSCKRNLMQVVNNVCRRTDAKDFLSSAWNVIMPDILDFMEYSLEWRDQKGIF